MWGVVTAQEVREAELLVEEALAAFADTLPDRVVEQVRVAMIEGLLCSEDGRLVLARLAGARG
ncbi:MAG: hypothetical protein HOW73_32240 [Polyangiaceae bacterium]|nr:hypothetical protein [Polyangiaceae bacterium]